MEIALGFTIFVQSRRRLNRGRSLSNLIVLVRCLGLCDGDLGPTVDQLLPVLMSLQVDLLLIEHASSLLCAVITHFVQELLFG